MDFCGGRAVTDLLVLNAQFVVELFQVFTKLLLPVPSTERDLKYLTAGRIRCQSGQTLTATPTNAHEEGVALVHPDNPMDPGQVLQSIVKEYQIHWLVGLIVLLQDLRRKNQLTPCAPTLTPCVPNLTPCALNLTPWVSNLTPCVLN